VALPLAAQPWTTAGSNIYYTGGNVGIGTSTPSIPLEVSGAMGPTSTENLSAASGQLRLNSSSGIAMKAGTDTLATLQNSNGSSILTLNTGSFPRLNFGASGAAYLGTYYQSGWLDLVNSGPISIHSGSTYMAVTGSGFLAQNGSFIGVGDNHTGYRMLGFTWSRAGLESNGQVAMGISTLAAPYAGGNLLLVAGGNENGAYEHPSQSDPTLIIHSRTAAATATNQWLSFQHNTSDGIIQTGAGSLILNPASGHIGIGTATPCTTSAPTDCRMSVNGAIQAKEVVVNTGWSDYVFDAGHTLTPLNDVAHYIALNHHLPGIPSAQEVSEKGVSLGEMQAKLLAKIEELTLHLIDDEQKIAQLEKAQTQEKK
jgi:hypothetical protein